MRSAESALAFPQVVRRQCAVFRRTCEALQKLANARLIQDDVIVNEINEAKQSN